MFRKLFIFYDVQHLFSSFLKVGFLIAGTLQV